MQQYRGQPVLTMWQGIIAGTPGHKNLPSPEPEPGAKYLIYNDHYRLIRTVTARNGWTADQHEFLITPQGDALFTVFKRVPMNLKKYGGPKRVPGSVTTGFRRSISRPASSCSLGTSSSTSG